jgi:hypothetical protein
MSPLLFYEPSHSRKPPRPHRPKAKPGVSRAGLAELKVPMLNECRNFDSSLAEALPAILQLKTESKASPSLLAIALLQPNRIRPGVATA